MDVGKKGTIPPVFFRAGESIKHAKDDGFTVVWPLETSSINSGVFLLKAPPTATPIGPQAMRLLWEYFHGGFFDFSSLRLALQRGSSGIHSDIMAHTFSGILKTLLYSLGEFLDNNPENTPAFSIAIPQSLKWEKLRGQTHAKILDHSSQTSSRFESARIRVRVYEHEALCTWRVIFPSVRIATHDQITLGREILRMNVGFLQPLLALPTAPIIRFEDFSGYRQEEIGEFLVPYIVDGKSRLMAVYPGPQMQPVTEELLERAGKFGIGIDLNK